MIKNRPVRCVIYEISVTVMHLRFIPCDADDDHWKPITALFEKP